MGRKKSRREGDAAALKRLFGRRAPGGGGKSRPGAEAWELNGRCHGVAL